MYACLGVTCYLHCWQNDRGLLLATSVTRGVERKQNKRQHKIVEEQAGLRKSYSTVNHIFALNTFVQKHLENRGAKMYIAFVDFRKAFD